MTSAKDTTKVATKSVIKTVAKITPSVAFGHLEEPRDCGVWPSI